MIAENFNAEEDALHMENTIDGPLSNLTDMLMYKALYLVKIEEPVGEGIVQYLF